MKEKPLRIGIIDDEQDAIRYLTMLLADLPDYIVSFTETEPTTGLNKVKEGKCDVLLLDLMMPGLKGHVLAGLIKDADIPVIFISGHDMSAKDAFEVKAVDFLSKPVSLVRLIDSLGKARKTIHSATGSKSTHKWLTASDSPDLFLSTGINTFQRIPVSDIIFIRGGSDYSEFVTAAQKYFDQRPLKELVPMLSEYGIIRVHKSFMVNLNKALIFSPHKVKMADGREIPVGRTYREGFLQIIREKVR